LVDNDGPHGPTEVSASIFLTNGIHKFEIGYFQNGGGMTLSASWSGPGISKQEIPEDVLYVSEMKNAFNTLRAFKNIIPDQELIYNYCPSFLHDDVGCTIFLSWKSYTPLTEWTHISVVYSNKVQFCFRV